MERLGVTKVGVMVEWNVSGVATCELCADMAGAVMTTQESRGMIPRHPNCACAFIPANVGEDPNKPKTFTVVDKPRGPKPTGRMIKDPKTGRMVKRYKDVKTGKYTSKVKSRRPAETHRVTIPGQKRSKAEIQKAIDDSIRAEMPKIKKRTLAEQKDRTSWAGADKTIRKVRPRSILEPKPTPRVRPAPKPRPKLIRPKKITPTKITPRRMRPKVVDKTEELKEQLAKQRAGRIEAQEQLREIRETAKALEEKTRKAQAATRARDKEIADLKQSIKAREAEVKAIDKKLRAQDIARERAKAVPTKVEPRQVRVSTGQMTGTKADKVAKEIDRELTGMGRFRRLSEMRKGKEIKAIQIRDPDELAVVLRLRKEEAGKFAGVYMPKQNRMVLAGDRRIARAIRPETGKWTIGNDLASDFRDEYGHVVQEKLLLRNQWTEWKSLSKKYVKKPAGEKLVSKYGATNDSELFAESFTAYTSEGYKRGLLPQDIEKFLDTYIKGVE